MEDNGKYDIGEVNSFSLSRNIFYGGSGVVDLRFYAWADKDHMPITGILVDWGDGTQSGNTNMIAKNHKPKCCESNDSCSNLEDAKNIGYIYDSDKDITEVCSSEQNCLNFGNIPEACESGEQGDKFFIFSHIYTCSTSDKYFDSNKGYCLFSPKVYIKDNWGWCNTGRPEKEDDFCPKASSEVSKDWPKVIVYPFEE